jgi:hypothetical protein
MFQGKSGRSQGFALSLLAAMTSIVPDQTSKWTVGTVPSSDKITAL